MILLMVKKVNTYCCVYYLFHLINTIAKLLLYIQRTFFIHFLVFTNAKIYVLIPSVYKSSVVSLDTAPVLRE